MIVGMDFGTTNSGLATYDGRTLNVLPLDPAHSDPRVVRSALYIRNDQNVLIGRAALDRYLADNVGRASKMQRVWVGELEIRGADMYYVTDAYVLVDVFSPGRLFLSFKTGLRDGNYAGTVVGPYFYPLEDIVAVYLTVLRERAQKMLGRPLREVVLGRPVRFATDPAHDRLAQNRLLQAAFRAGYETVYLQQEPVAAAFHYAAQAGQPQTILVFDFGGGTLDLTVMRIDGRRRDVLATGGLPVAGDVFDQKLVRAKLPPHFGEGSTYGPIERPLPVPRWLYDIFSDWQRIVELQTPENRQVLEEIRQTAHRPREIEGLVSLVTGNYGLKMFDAAEQAKRELSERIGTMIRLQGPDFKILEMVTRSEFETLIRSEIMAIESHIDEIVAASGLQPSQIDAVIRTGGSSEIPVFQKLLAKRFGADRLHSASTFSSVTAGLAILGEAIAAGDVSATPYTEATLAATTRPATESAVPPVNVHLMRRRIARREGDSPDPAAGLASLLVSLHAGHVHAHLPAAGDVLEHTIPAGESPISARLAAPDEPLLLLTSHYRFLRFTARQLLELPEMGLTLRDVFLMTEDEHVAALTSWTAVRRQPLFLIATSRGYARVYGTEALAPLIEGPVAHQFDQPLPGRPRFITGASPHDDLVVAGASGRATRTPLAAIPHTGRQVINCKADDWVVDGAVGRPEAELLLLAANGYGRRLASSAIFTPTRPNRVGKMLLTRKPLIAIAPAATVSAVLTNRRLVAVDVTAVPRDDTSTRGHRLLKLDAGEEARAVVSNPDGDRSGEG